ncbi:ribosomal protein S6 modification protein [Salmonella enterica subsp. enterica]|uniref:Ribosomal protein S6 modification protein n=1 Tax=Salmonella enterica I TaxID=59201 RepID=A0A447U6B8_SALET|nr:ribosomal protein S6 modification protein [Salmonella enterica subsp. enterica]
MPKLKDAIFVVWSSAMRLWRRLSGARKPVIFAPIFIVAGWPASRRSRPVNGISPSKAAQTLGLDVAGVDILRAARGPLVMEVNASPGLEGIEKTTGVDIAGRMIQWIERHATPEFLP